MADGTFAGLLQTLDPDPHTRGKQFEKLVKWWAQNDPIHSRDIKQIWLWNEWPDRSGPDIGIDLVALMHDGTHCAIQAKCHDPERDIPKSELDSFISAASPRTFKHRWLVASTDGLSANAKRALADNHVTQILYSYLDSLTGFWPTSLTGISKPATITKASPRPHQQEAIKDVVQGLQKASRGQLIMACGTGKTLTALWITESLKPKTTLVLVPSLSLLSQTLSEWAKNTNIKWNYLCVCSDETVNKSDDAPISTTDELPFDVTTKPADIANFLNQRGHKIIFSTYQSSAQVAKATRSSGTKFDLMICDEAHRLTGKNDADFSTPLDDARIPADKRLFMTATPRTYTARVKAKASERGVDINSMDDPIIFGHELHRLSFGQAIEQDLLTDYQVVIVGVSSQEAKDLIDRREIVILGDHLELDAKTLAAHIGVAKATKEFNLKRIISFHSRIKTARDFATQHAQVVNRMPVEQRPEGTIWADSITGAMKSSVRRTLLQKLREDVPSRHALLSNARCLTEGVDVPTLDGVAFIDPRSSQVDIIQAVGRAIRKSEEKQIGTIILPIFISEDFDFDDLSSQSDFRNILQVINGLKSHDNQLDAELVEIRTKMGRGSTYEDLPKKIIFLIPTSINLEFPNFSKSLTTRIVELTTSPWEYWFGRLSEYAEANGHSSPKKRNERGEIEPLGSWVVSQRVQHSKGTLSKRRATLLESLPQWEWDLKEHEVSTETKVEMIRQFTNNHGELPEFKNRTKIFFNGHPIHDYVNQVRSYQRQGNLDPQSTKILEGLPGWDWRPANLNSWDSAFEILKAFVEREGHANVPQYHHEGDFALGQWVANQRNTRRRHRVNPNIAKRIDPERDRRLESLPGWVWDRHEAAFKASVAALRSFYDREGHYRIPHGHIENGIGIGRFIRNLRGDYRYRRHRLTDADISAVEDLPTWTWFPQEERWERSISALRRYVQDHGNLSPTASFRIDEINLFNFIHATRRSYRLGKLANDRIEQLESIPGWTWGN